MVRGWVFLSLLSASLLLGGCAADQSTTTTAAAAAPAPPPEPTSQGSDDVLLDDPEDEKPQGPIKIEQAQLGPGDELELTVYRHDEFNTRVRIPQDGEFFVPLIGAFNVNGMDVAELRRDLTTRLDQYIVNPQVMLVVRVRRSQKYVVIGEVRRPGVFAIAENTSAAEAVALAGGFTLEGSKKRVVLVRKRGELEPTMQIINLDRTLKEGALSQNLQMQSGDILYIPANRLAKTDRFARHLSTWLQPLLLAETGINAGLDIDTKFDDDDFRTTTNVIVTSP